MARTLLREPTVNNLRGKRAGLGAAWPFVELGFPPLGIMVWDDHFVGDLFYGGAAPGVYQSTAAGAASVTLALVAGAVGGRALLDAGTDDDGRSDMSLGLHYQGQLNCVVWWRFQVNTLSTMKFELGFTDVVSGTDAGAALSKSGNTWTATDAVVLIIDTDDDANLSLMGVDSGVAATPVDFDVALVAATFYYLGLALEDTVAEGVLLDANGRFLDRKTITAACSEDVGLTPWAFVQNRSTVQRTMTIDRLVAYQRESDN